MNEMYQKMVNAGINMDWYTKSKGINGKIHETPALTDEYCGRLSVYLLEPNGTLYTVAGDGNRYMTVRYTEGRPKQRVYVCAHCKGQWPTFGEATKHFM